VRLILPNAITLPEAHALAKENDYLNFMDDRLTKIKALIRENCNVSFDDPAYVRVEAREEGHPRHIDAAKHMSWCHISARILLTAPGNSFTGGGFYFDDTPEDDPIFNYRSLILYDSDNYHRVAPHRGNRRILLMFLGQHE
jgi:hypothetical protein